jgi:uncharacterized protein (DUF305 family)
MSHLGQGGYPHKIVTGTFVLGLILGGLGVYVFLGNNLSSTDTHVMPDGATMSETMAGMTAGLEGKSGDDFDRAFIEGMIEHHEGAVAMAQQALLSAKHPEIKQIANDIIAAQTREIDTMRGWLRSWYGVQ